MNREKVLELAREAGFLVDNDVFRASVGLFECFAQQIVQECAAVSRSSSHRSDDMGSIIAQDIERHFGIGVNGGKA